MHKVEVIRTFSDTAFTMVELPFADGGIYSMLIILPENNRQRLAEWAAGLNAERLDDAMTKMTNQLIDLYLPRWDYNYAIDDLGGIFTRLGMNIAMTAEDESDFSNMFRRLPG
jgi:serine protease inhibitor